MQNTVCRMAIAGPHKFLFEINDFLFVKTFIQMADIIDHLIVCLADRSRCQLIVIVIEASPVKVFIQVIGKEQHRTLKQRIFKYQ